MKARLSSVSGRDSELSWFSCQPLLYIFLSVNAGAPELQIETTSLLMNASYDLKCRSTATRPAALVIMKIGENSLTGTNAVKVNDSTALISVTKTVTLIASKSHNNLALKCMSQIPDQGEFSKTEKLIKVLCKYIFF